MIQSNKAKELKGEKAKKPVQNEDGLLRRKSFDSLPPRNDGGGGNVWKRRGKVVFWLAVLLGFNYMLYFIYVMPLKDISMQHTPIIATGGGQPQTGLPQKEIIIGNTPILVELAQTTEQRRVGLMYRASLGEKEGMLFVFDKEQVMNFWMQNTYIPLDLLYVGSDQTIKHIHKGAKILDLTGLPSIEPAQYVIEVNSGFVEQFGVKVGDVVKGI